MFDRSYIGVSNRNFSVNDQGHTAGYFHRYRPFRPENSRCAERRIDVFLPRNYDTNDHRYPVLYLNDGHTAFFEPAMGDQSWDIANTLGALYERRSIRELIVIAMYPVNRAREYTHAHWCGSDCCGLESYAQCVAESIKPFIDRSYRTLPESGTTMIVGSSHGGLAAFYMANRRPDAFGYAGALSPSFWVGVDDAESFPLIKPLQDRVLKDSQLLAAVKETLAAASRRPKLYLDWGLVRTGGLHNESIEERATARGREMVKLLQQKYDYKIGNDLIVYEDPAGEHNEKSWGRRVPRVLEFFVNNKDQLPPAFADNVS
jgi:predicted alpha/beta superfamily hydrolase